MVDEIKKNIVPNSDENNENKENLDKDLDFSDELSKLEDQIRDVAGDKIQKREQKIFSETSGELDSLNAEIGLSGLDKKVNEKGKDKVSEFFGKGKEEFKKIDTFKEERVVKKYGNINNKLAYRSGAVKEAIEKSADNILDEIYNWKEEKDPVARSLLRIVSWIMSSEKNS